MTGLLNWLFLFPIYLEGIDLVGEEQAPSSKAVSIGRLAAVYFRNKFRRIYRGFF